MDSKKREDRNSGSRNCYASSEDVPEVLFEIAEDAPGVPFHCAQLKWWTDGIFGWMEVRDGGAAVVSVGIHISDGKLSVGIYDKNDEPISQHEVDA